MKTNTNLSRIARNGLASVAVLLSSALVPALAGNDSDSARNGDNKTRLEVEAAYDRLDALTSAIEKSVKFTATLVNEDIVTYEAQAAEERLENLNLTVAEAIRYEASMVNEEAEAHELALAEERLENLNMAIIEQIKFTAPEIVENTLEYAESIDYIIPSNEVAMQAALTR